MIICMLGRAAHGCDHYRNRFDIEYSCRNRARVVILDTKYLYRQWQRYNLFYVTPGQLNPTNLHIYTSQLPSSPRSDLPTALLRRMAVIQN
jgi:hypothetical protein